MPLTMALNFTLEQYRYLLGPVVMHKSSFGPYPCPGWMKKIIFKERLTTVMNELEERCTKGMASLPEIMMMMIPASQDAPLQHDDMACLDHCMSYVLQTYQPKGLDYAAMFGNHNPPSYGAVRHTLTPYRFQLRSKIVKHAAARGISMDWKKQKAAPQPAPEAPKGNTAQLGFDFEAFNAGDQG